jgi:hypothetical protein
MSPGDGDDMMRADFAGMGICGSMGTPDAGHEREASSSEGRRGAESQRTMERWRSGTKA